jgi:hypothetical protein
MFVQLGYESAECCHHACQLLDFSSDSECLQLFNGFHLLWVHIDLASRYYVAKQFA